MLYETRLEAAYQVAAGGRPHEKRPEAPPARPRPEAANNQEKAPSVRPMPSVLADSLHGVLSTCMLMLTLMRHAR